MESFKYLFCLSTTLQALIALSIALANTIHRSKSFMLVIWGIITSQSTSMPNCFAILNLLLKRASITIFCVLQENDRSLVTFSSLFK